MNKIDLKDVSFLIPFYFDHQDRVENLAFLVDYLTKQFDTNILIKEVGETPRVPHSIQSHGNVSYFFERLKKGEPFHRTKYLNDLCKQTSTPIVVNQDTDVIVPYHAYLDAVQMISSGEYKFVVPYDGRFMEMPRPKLSVLKEQGFYGLSESDLNCLNPNSFGGIIFEHRETFLESGMENEAFISWAFEDNERMHRFDKLGHNIGRTNNHLIHIEHWRGPNSGPDNPYYMNNLRELRKVEAMSKEELVEYIKTWRK